MRSMLEILDDMETAQQAIERYVSEHIDNESLDGNAPFLADLVNKFKAFHAEFNKADGDPGEDSEEAIRYVNILNSYANMVGDIKAYLGI